ncbi:DUF4139 domain-containing protein [Nocardia uniformis]|uniref:DUF4139 domain-containing protein n=1 Tax=Nocardia uniformis TaxID=53432 RepID=A0A849CDT0_9NOCA|nr:DUF4139 domain-containing protein [Nocardia uniformis]NNH73339.1 DUF4139 domain-containing protein [Nocardia uniformis]
MPTVSAPIVAVTVYPQQARVTRRARYALTDEPRATIAGLPVALAADSVRVTGSGPARIVGVDVRVERHAEPADPGLRELVEQREALQAKSDGLTDEEAAATAKVDLLNGLAQRSGSSFAKALASGDAAPGRVAEVGDALATQLAHALKDKRALHTRLARLADELSALDRRIAASGAQPARDSTSVIIELEPTGDGEVELELSYVVGGASWEAGYDIRVADKEVAVTSYGLVTQNTGEDWPECELALSTARPAVSVVVPELEPWFLDRVQPIPVSAMRAAGYGGPPPAPGAAFAADAEEAMPRRRMAPHVAAAEQGTTAVTYRTTRPVAIPSGAKGHRTTLALLDFPAELGYITAPVLAEEAHLRATVSNTSEHTLRAGKASIFHGDEFVGTTRLETWAPGEELELALGVDDRIRVERKLVRRTASKAALSGSRRREAEYRTTITNHSPADITIAVLDQAPVSRDEAIAVKDIRTSPDPAETTELGEYTWKLRVEPGKSSAVTLSYRVDVAKGVEIAGWR